MKYLTITLVLAFTGMFLLWPGTEELEPEEFADALQHTEEKILIDLRSAREFSNGHIPGAINIDANWPTYKWRIAELDTGLRLFLYTGNGYLDEKPAVIIRSRRFRSVTLLKGGINNWIGQGYSVTPKELIAPPELAFADFSRMLDLEHLVIVYFYLPGNNKCRNMEHVLDELALAYRDTIRILRIDIDRYKYLATEMGIEDVPVLQFYQNGNLCETIEGIFTKDAIESRFRLQEYVNDTPALIY